MSEIKLQTGPHIFEVLGYMCHSPIEALDQFVENAADAVEQSGESKGCIRIQLDHFPNQQVQPSLIVVEDNGIGMGPEKMRQVVQSIGNSEKMDRILRGEKGIGILSFASIANELHLCSHNSQADPTSCLVLKREWLRDGLAQVVQSCPQHPPIKHGTRAYLMGVLPEVAPQLTRARLKQYFSREFATDLRRNLYTLYIGDKHSYESVEPRQFRGIPLVNATIDLGTCGHASVQLYALPVETPEAAIDVYGRGGIRICNLTSLEEFQRLPWLDQKIEGGVRCDRLQGTADKTAIVQNEVYKALAEALHKLEPEMFEKMGQIAQEYRDSRLAEIMSRVDTFIGRLLHYRQLGYIPEMPGHSHSYDNVKKATAADSAAPAGADSSSASHSHAERRASVHPTYLHANLCLPPQDDGRFRTWCDDSGNIEINTLHRDFLAAERDDKRCAWYLFSAWAKKYLMTEYGSDPDTMTDEMVGLFSQAGPLLNQITFRTRSGPPVATSQEKTAVPVQ